MEHWILKPISGYPFHRYEEHFHNCYTYALTFINCVLSAQGKKQMNKSEFTERFVIPRTRKASKYITIYKEICNSGFYVIDDPDQEEGTSTGYHEAYTNRNGSSILRSWHWYSLNSSSSKENKTLGLLNVQHTLICLFLEGIPIEFKKAYLHECTDCTLNFSNEPLSFFQTIAFNLT